MAQGEIAAETKLRSNMDSLTHTATPHSNWFGRLVGKAKNSGNTSSTSSCFNSSITRPQSSISSSAACTPRIHTKTPQTPQTPLPLPAHIELEELKRQNTRLAGRCFELTTQSLLNQEILHQCAEDLCASEAENTSLKKHIQRLHNDLISQKAANMRLQAMGCLPSALSPSDELDLRRQIDTLTCENTRLKEDLTKHKSDMKLKILDYAEECNELTDALRYASADATCSRQRALLAEHQFSTLKAEYDLLVSSSTSPQQHGPEHPKPHHHDHHDNDKPERDPAFVVKLKSQHDRLVKDLKAQQDSHAAQSHLIQTLYAENERDRRSFCKTLLARDAQIQRLEKSSLCRAQSDAAGLRDLQARLARSEDECVRLARAREECAKAQEDVICDEDQGRRGEKGGLEKEVEGLRKELFIRKVLWADEGE
ncbi:hypothetical protein ACEQ8H_003116 [Pleosporales sp. CAS-2024a]